MFVLFMKRPYVFGNESQLIKVEQNLPFLKRCQCIFTVSWSFQTYFLTFKFISYLLHPTSFQVAQNLVSRHLLGLCPTLFLFVTDGVAVDDAVNQKLGLAQPRLFPVDQYQDWKLEKGRTSSL